MENGKNRIANTTPHLQHHHHSNILLVTLSTASSTSRSLKEPPETGPLNSGNSVNSQCLSLKNLHTQTHVHTGHDHMYIHATPTCHTHVYIHATPTCTYMPHPHAHTCHITCTHDEFSSQQLAMETMATMSSGGETGGVALQL